MLHFDKEQNVSTNNFPILNEQQSLVHQIISSHLHVHLADLNPSQCLMIVHGQGGTEKLAMLNAIAQTFASNNTATLLARMAM